MTPHAYGAALSPGSVCKAGISGTFLCIDPATHLVVAYLTNYGDGGGDFGKWHDDIAPDQVIALAAASVPGMSTSSKSVR